MRAVRDFLITSILPFFIAPIVYLYSLSWRLKITGDPESLRRFVHGKEPVLYAHWHGDEIVLVPFYAFRGLAVLSSLSKDGTLMAKTLRLLGYRVFRGSSSKGGARGLLGLIHSVESGSQAALAVDGPKGPIYEVKAGIAELAFRTGKPVVPLRVRAETYWPIPRAWNRSFVPKPRTVVEVNFAPVIEPKQLAVISRAAKSEAVDELTKKIQKSLDHLSSELGLLDGPQ